jgi:hypothetical protein
MSVELPPLPPMGYGNEGYCTDHMHAYARAAVDAALEAVAKARPCCPSCGTHEVSQQQTCHNSACEAYARDVTIYEGWRVQKSSPLASGPVGGD